VRASRIFSLRLSGTDRVPVRTELPGLVFTAGSAERVNDGTELHLSEACALDHCHPPCTRQGTGNSAGPQIDVAERGLGDGFLHADVSDLGATTRLQDSGDLPVGAEFVRDEVDHPV
jgi:hypothetical protein